VCTGEMLASEQMGGDLLNLHLLIRSLLIDSRTDVGEFLEQAVVWARLTTFKMPINLQPFVRLRPRKPLVPRAHQSVCFCALCVSHTHKARVRKEIDRF